MPEESWHRDTKQERKMFLPHRYLNHGHLEPKDSVLPMSYPDPLINRCREKNTQKVYLSSNPLAQHPFAGWNIHQLSLPPSHLMPITTKAHEQCHVLKRVTNKPRARALQDTFFNNFQVSNHSLKLPTAQSCIHSETILFINSKFFCSRK